MTNRTNHRIYSIIKLPLYSIIILIAVTAFITPSLCSAAGKKGNHKPVFVKGYPEKSYFIFGGQLLQIWIRAIDSDSDAIKIRVDSITLPRPKTISLVKNGRYKVLTWQSMPNEEGIYSLRLKASDGKATALLRIGVTIRPPVIRNMRSRCCPYVYLWDKDADKYRYYTDLSGSPLSKSVDFFKPEYYGENIYELGDFSSDQGLYRIKIREIVLESCYFDKLKLLVVDIPPGYDVLNQWSFTSELDRYPSRGFLAIRNPRSPVSAINGLNVSVLAEVSEIDEIPLPVANGGISRTELDFGRISNPQYAKLILTAWGYYDDLSRYQKPPYCSGTTIETRDEHGKWKVRKIAGKSAGDRKTWVIDIKDILRADDTRIRLTMAHNPSVLDVLDAIQLDDSPPVECMLSEISPVKADLCYGGSAQILISSLTNRNHADDTTLPLIPEAMITGNYTRYGDVLPLLDSSDDRFVIMAHGDEILAEYKEPLPNPGYIRKVFMKADVFYTLRSHPLKEHQLTVTIEPLPYHGMKTYPYDLPLWPYGNDQGYNRYLKGYNTRYIDASKIPGYR